LLLPNEYNEIKASENILHHRGIVLVNEAQQLCGSVTCPCHAWPHDLNSQLSKTRGLAGPDVHEHDTVNHSDSALNEVRPCRWRYILVEDMFVVEGMQKAVSPANMMTTNSQL
jgi:phenylpropionate dioxygenase-like ring-hydroxylating dioxygenase large terminal subunit